MTDSCGPSLRTYLRTLLPVRPGAIVRKSPTDGSGR
jgi:hypothetical protein